MLQENIQNNNSNSTSLSQYYLTQVVSDPNHPIKKTTVSEILKFQDAIPQSKVSNTKEEQVVYQPSCDSFPEIEGKGPNVNCTGPIYIPTITNVPSPKIKVWDILHK